MGGRGGSDCASVDVGAACWTRPPDIFLLGPESGLSNSRLPVRNFPVCSSPRWWDPVTVGAIVVMHKGIGGRRGDNVGTLGSE